MPMPPDPAPQRVIGWKERIDFPDWGLRRVRAKIDSGARTSALGAVYYEMRESAGAVLVELVLALDRKRPDRVVHLTAPVLGTVAVTNSGGERELRPYIETAVRIGPVTKVVRFSVTYRRRMRFPLILGRRALAGDFVVDVSRAYLLRKRR
jgi:hypothetical protein